MEKKSASPYRQMPERYSAEKYQEQEQNVKKQPENDQLSEKKSAEKSPDEKNTSKKRPVEKRSTEKNVSEKKAAEKKSVEKPSEGKRLAERQSAKKQSPERHSEGKRQTRKENTKRTADRNKKNSHRNPEKNNILPALAILAVLFLAAAAVFAVVRHLPELKQRLVRETSATGKGTKKGKNDILEMVEDTSEEGADGGYDFQPVCTENTKPSNMIALTGISVDGTELTDESSYKPDAQISFETGAAYTDLEGVITFRGNNFRDNPSYGTAEMKDNTLNKVWSKTTGALSYNNSSWTGNGWTGQPLLVKWPQETKKQMNMHDWAKEDKELVEVIYASMDGFVYFLDLKTGKATRDALELGYTFKGAGALDPRGYPILYVGAGYDSYNGTAHVFVISLLDGSVMYEFGANDVYSLRGSLSYFDSSALVDAETDTLIYPGENGILYLIRLNTAYNAEAGTLSINPSPVVKWHYYGNRSSTYNYWVGMEDSAAVYKGYLFVADNGGHLMCMNLNTLQLVWVQDILDDSNSTPVLSLEDGHLYLYVSTSFRLGWRSSYSATVPVWKIDAENGEIVWQKDYECYSDDGVSGGVQSTIASGKNELSDYIYVTVARVEDYSTGVLACLNKKTGEVVWEHSSYYAWSSPVCVYDSEGKGNVVYCDSVGNMFLIDGKTGEELHKINLDDSNIEASPAVYDNYVIVGTRGCNICGIELK